MIPKFRAWDKYHEIMVIIISIDFERKIAYVGREDGDRWEIHFDNLNFMQSTGLKGYMNDKYEDDQEKDVYKGDIIDIFWEEWPAGFYQENHMVGVVSLDKTGTAWVIKNAKYSSDGESIPDEIDGMKISRSLPDEEDLAEVPLHGFDFSSDDITILGNIYEHTELLKVR